MSIQVFQKSSLWGRFTTISPQSNDDCLGEVKSTNTKSLAKEFLKILTVEYFGFLKKASTCFFTLIPNHPA